MGALTHNGEVLQSLPADASQINFDKTGTDLNSTQTENAIKEVNTKANTNADDIDQLKSGLTNAIYRKNITVQTASIGSDFENVIDISDMSDNGYIDIILSYGGYNYACRFNVSNSFQKCLVTSSIILELEMSGSYVLLKLVGASTTGTVSKITQDYIV